MMVIRLPSENAAPRSAPANIVGVKNVKPSSTATSEARLLRDAAGTGLSG